MSSADRLIALEREYAAGGMSQEIYEARKSEILAGIDDRTSSQAWPKAVMTAVTTLCTVVGFLLILVGVGAFRSPGQGLPAVVWWALAAAVIVFGFSVRRVKG